MLIHRFRVRVHPQCVAHERGYGLVVLPFLACCMLPVGLSTAPLMLHLTKNSVRFPLEHQKHVGHFLWWRWVKHWWAIGWKIFPKPLQWQYCASNRGFFFFFSMKLIIHPKYCTDIAFIAAFLNWRQNIKNWAVEAGVLQKLQIVLLLLQNFELLSFFNFDFVTS